MWDESEKTPLILVYIFTNTCQIRHSVMSAWCLIENSFFPPFLPMPSSPTPPPNQFRCCRSWGGVKTRSSLLPEKEWTVLKVSNESCFQINLSWLWSLLECQRSSLLALVGWCHSKTHACVSETGLQIWDRLLTVSLWDAFIRNLWKYCQVHVFYFLFSVSVLQVWAAMRV